MGVPATGLLFFRHTILDVLGTGNIVAVLRHAGTQAEDSEMLKIVVNFFFCQLSHTILKHPPQYSVRAGRFPGVDVAQISPHVWSHLTSCVVRTGAVSPEGIKGCIG